MGAGAAVICAAAGAATLTPPSVQYLDKFGVNMLNGQVNSTLETVAIGGAMGLSHGISLYSNHFVRAGERGYHDRYAGGALFTQLLGPNFVWPIMRVYDFGGSVDFRIMTGESFYAGDGSEAAGTVKYIALQDRRHALVVTGPSQEFLDWTKPDGTVTRFARSANPRVSTPGRVLQVTFPTGFTIYQDYLRRVYTNTGFSIVYQYEADNRPAPDYCKPGQPPGVPPCDAYAWALHNPRHVKAVNNAACSTGSVSCMQRAWPTATFTWPAGMPRPMYMGKNSFSVETPVGTTTYEYEPYDLAKDGDIVVQGFALGDRISPRLHRIKPATSTSPTLTYTYKNLWVYTSVGVRDDLFGVEYTPPTGTFPAGMGGYATLVKDAGVILTSKLIEKMNAYEMGQPYVGDGAAQNLGRVVGGVWQIILNVGSTPSLVTSVNTGDELIFFEANPRNFPMQVRRSTGPIDDLVYTPRGNLQTIATNGVVMSRAVYGNENYCSTLPKICNQATSIFDAKNNETKFEYHTTSGQVSRVIPPADQNGRISEVRYDYQPMRARYFGTGGDRVEGEPIYMKVAERHCHDSNYLSPDSKAHCASGDEVVIRYFYDSNNLLLTSVATTASNGKTLRTCFQYDVYGNKLGETQPKGASSCN